MNDWLRSSLFEDWPSRNTAQVDFVDRGMLPPTIFQTKNHLSATKRIWDAEDSDDEEQNCLEMVEGNVILSHTQSMFYLFIFG